MNVGKVASHAYARRGSVGVDRAAKCPAQNRVSQKHTRFHRVSSRSLRGNFGFVSRDVILRGPIDYR